MKSTINQEATQQQIADILKRPSKSLPSSHSSITTSSTLVVSANENRRGLVLTNTGSYPLFIGIGEDAIADEGIYLVASGGVWVMDRYTFTNKKINAIGIGGTTNIAVQEFE